MAGYDIGPGSVELFREILMKSGTVVWNGPMGLFEVPPFDSATRATALILADATAAGAVTIVGGGDSLRAVTEAGALEKVTHASTGGGASLELLQGNDLPALKHIAVQGIRPLVGANWKMNGTLHLAQDYLDDLLVANSMHFGADVVLFPPFTILAGLAGPAEDAGVFLGGQDLYWEEKGAFTGEISPGMLKGAGCSWFLAGHSERRHILKENDEMVARKLHAGISAGLKGILCVGETLSEREAGNTRQVVIAQVEAALRGIRGADPGNLAIAYEPVWAIGTGRNATAEQAQEVHELIRECVGGILGKEFANETRIIYGGSVTPGNAAGILAQPDVNGALVGGASLDSESFLDILASF
jgi:triosephosphate isomerase